jgi:hypothetical protein
LTFGGEACNSQTFDNIVEENYNKTLTIYVNGKQLSFGTDFRQIPVNAHDEIAIIYGKPPNSIPSSYKYPNSL